MPAYKAYAKSKDTPGRGIRKGDRARTFLLNKNANKKLKRVRKEAREAAAEQAEG